MFWRMFRSRSRSASATPAPKAGDRDSWELSPNGVRWYRSDLANLAQSIATGPSSAAAVLSATREVEERAQRRNVEESLALVVAHAEGGSAEYLAALKATLVLDLSGLLSEAELLRELWEPIEARRGISDAARSLVNGAREAVPYLRHRTRLDNLLRSLTGAANRHQAHLDGTGDTSPADDMASALVESFLESLEGPVPLDQLRKEYLEPLLQDSSTNATLTRWVRSCFDRAVG
jgi:hypothetical protein